MTMNWNKLPSAERLYVYNAVRSLSTQSLNATVPISARVTQSLIHAPRTSGVILSSFSHYRQGGVQDPLPGLISSRYPPLTLLSVVSAVPALPYTTWPATAVGLGASLILQRQTGATTSSWPHYLYSRARRKELIQVRHKSTRANASKKEGIARATEAKAEAPSHDPTLAANVAEQAPQDKHLLGRLPDISRRFHRPTKEELLAAATGFWSRMRVRFKWFSIRDIRPFNLDDLSAFFSWVLVGHVIWILVGTTTFFSLLILTVNTVFAQETLARWVGNYLTKSSGVKVVFESAIVPKWGDGVITFKNVFVSRRPGQQQSRVVKGSPMSAAAAAAAAAAESASERADPEEEDTNYTQYDLSIETVNVTLSFAKWFNGKGLLRDVEIKGVRGVVDRTSVTYSGDYVDPRSYRHEHQAGDFEIESLKLEDLLVSIYQPHNFRPYSVSIFSADLPQLRKQWLFYDLLSANHMSGSFDESLFTIHPRQTHNYTGAQLSEGAADQDNNHWKKHSRIRIDGLKIDHLNRGVEGPFSWIHEGNVDIVADIMFPADNDEGIAKVMTDFYERMEATVASSRYLHLASQPQPRSSLPKESSVINNSPSTPQEPPAAPIPMQHEHDNRFLILDLRIHLNSVHALVPLFTQDLSYVNLALIRPIVAYINSKKQIIPINCRVVKRASEFDGSWTIYDSGLMEDLSRETYEAFARDVVDDQARMRRIKKVGLWSLQLAVQALFLGLAGHIA